MNVQYKFCVYCGKLEEILVRCRIIKQVNNNVSFCYEEQYALCQNCGMEIYVPEINDVNCNARNQAYHQTLREMQIYEQSLMN